jgi:HEAT repeat protein
MLQYYSPQEKDPKPVVRPTDRAVLEKIIFEILDNIVPLAYRGLNDPDPVVRRDNLDTLQRIAVALILEQEIRLADQRGSYPARGRTATPDEIKKIRADREALNAELNRLRPRLKTYDEAAQGLKQALEDRNPEIRAQALRLTEDLALLSERIRQRVQAIPKVDEKGRVVGQLVSLTSAQPDQRAPRAPGELLDNLLRKIEPDVVQKLKDPRSRVRLAAANVIENLGPEARHLGPQLIESLRDRNSFVRWVAARGLGRIGSPPVAGTIEGLGRLTHDPDLSVRAAVSYALEQFGPDAEAAVPDLLREANRGDAEVRQAVLKALGAIGKDGKRAVPLIARELTNEDVRVRRAAADALGRFGGDVALATRELERALKDDDAEVRRSASEALLNVPVK